jgi:hypothetical protein
MYGARLRADHYAAPTKDWDHDHCALCWAKFSKDEVLDALRDGLKIERPTNDEWICERCFADFSDRFGWSVVVAEPSER